MSIPFLGMLRDIWPKGQFIVTGVLGPKSNAHGPNEFLHIPYVKKLICAMTHILARKWFDDSDEIDYDNDWAQGMKIHVQNINYKLIIRTWWSSSELKQLFNITHCFLFWCFWWMRLGVCWCQSFCLILFSCFIVYLDLWSRSQCFLIPFTVSSGGFLKLSVFSFPWWRTHNFTWSSFEFVRTVCWITLWKNHH